MVVVFINLFIFFVFIKLFVFLIIFLYIAIILLLIIMFVFLCFLDLANDIKILHFYLFFIAFATFLIRNIFCGFLRFQYFGTAWVLIMLSAFYCAQDAFIFLVSVGENDLAGPAEGFNKHVVKEKFALAQVEGESIGFRIWWASEVLSRHLSKPNFEKMV